MNRFDDLADDAVATPVLPPPSMDDVVARATQLRRRRAAVRISLAAGACAVLGGGLFLAAGGDEPQADVRTATDDTMAVSTTLDPSPTTSPVVIEPDPQNPVVIEPDPMVGAPCDSDEAEGVGSAVAVGATTAFEGWLNTEPREDAAPYIQDWDEIGPSVLEAAAIAPLPLEQYEGEVRNLFFGVDDVVCVAYVIDNAGTPVLDAVGTAVLVDGEWKVSRETVCEALRAGTVRCPGEEVVIAAQPGCAVGRSEILTSAALVLDPSPVVAGCDVRFTFDPGLITAEVMGDDVVMRLVDDPSVVVQHSGVFTDEPFAALTELGVEDDGWPVSGVGTLHIPRHAQAGRYTVDFLDHPELSGEVTVQSFDSDIAITRDGLFAAARLFVTGEFSATPRRELSVGGSTRWAYSFDVTDVPWFGAEAAPYEPDAAESIELVVDDDLAAVIDRLTEPGQQWTLALGGVETAEGLMAATVWGPAGVFIVDDEAGELRSLDSRIGTLTAEQFAQRLPDE